MAKDSNSELLKTAHARLHPSLSNPSFLVLESRRKIFQNWIEQLGRRPATILDVGGRYQPYRPLFGGDCRYIACDVLQTELVNVVANGESLPFAAETFDAVVCTQVFEYFARPQFAAREAHRVLKPNGALFMSVAAFAPRFVDQEHWRYTPAGIRAVLSPFEKVTITAETSSLGGLCRAVNLGLHSFTHFAFLRRVYELTFCPCLNVAGLALEKLRITSDDRFAPNFSVLAIK